MKLTMRKIRKYNGCNSIHMVRWFARAYGLDMDELMKEGWDIEDLRQIDDVICKRIVKKLEDDHGRA